MLQFWPQGRFDREEMRKQLCMETMSPNDALQNAAMREREEIMYKRVSGGVSKLSGNKFHQGRQNAYGKIQQKRTSECH